MGSTAMNDTTTTENSDRGYPVVERIGGELHSIRRMLDESGRVVQQIATPLMVEFRFRDICQILVGACVLVIPVAYTEEVWTLGKQLPVTNILAICLISISFVTLFGYYVFYKGHLKGNGFEFAKRVIAVYVITFLVSATLLTLFQKCPWTTDPATAVGRIVLVTFPGCFSATVVDSLK
jgi:uncharacterized membrane protein